MTIPDQCVPLHVDTVSALHIWHLAFSTQYHRMTFCGYDKKKKYQLLHSALRAQGGLFVNYCDSHLHLQGETEYQGKCQNPEAEEGRAEMPGSREASTALST